MATNLVLDDDGVPCYLEGGNEIAVVLDDEGVPCWIPVEDTGVAPETADIEWWNRERSEWIRIAEGLSLGDTVSHATPYLDSNTYRAITHTSLPSDATGPELVHVVGEKMVHYINSGSAFGTVRACAGDPDFSSKPSRAKSLVKASGARWPLVLDGQARTRECSFSTRLIPQGHGFDWLTSIDEWEALSWESGVICYRDPAGRRIIGALTGVDAGQTGEAQQTVSLTFSQTET